MAFGEACRFKNQSHEPIGGIADGRRSHAGNFVGVDRRTVHYMLHDGETMSLARTVMRMPTADKWSKDALSAIASTPYNLHVPNEPEVVFRETAEAQGLQLYPKVALSRQV